MRILNILRIALSLACIFYGLVTFYGYFTIIKQNFSPTLLDLIFSFLFAGLFIVGGVLAILKIPAAIHVLITSCIFYLLAGLYQPIQIHGLSTFTLINPQFYFSLAVRCSLVAGIYFIFKRAQKNCG